MKKLVIGNLKMNLLNAQERERYLQWMEKELKGKKFKNSEIVLCPPFVHLEAFQKFKKIHPVEYRSAVAAKPLFHWVKLGAQDMFPETKGSYTGEVSPVMLKNFGCEYVIIGHSERRRYFAENNHEINLKLISALKNGLKPILCVGENKVEKDSHETLRVITRQVKEALVGISRAKAEQIIIAYEPVWAVGSDLIPTANEVMGAKLLIKKILVDLFGKKYAESVLILYGGSVSAKTVTQVCADSGMDGALIGRESLIPHEFVKIAMIIDKQD